jgi:DNA-binding IclR family transcriptional regulator
MGTIGKALALLELFSVARPEIGLAEFRRLTGRDKATLHRHLAELAAAGFVEQDRDSRLYRLGPAVVRLAAVRERCFPARAAVAPHVDALSRELGELVHVALLQGRALSPLYHADATIHATRVFYDEAELLPLHATSSGLAMLAFGPAELLETLCGAKLTRYTPHTPADPEALRAEVATTRARGWASSDESFEEEVVSQAVPLFGPGGGAAVGTLAVALPKGRATSETRARITAALLRAAAPVSAALGGTIPETLQRLWAQAA